MATHALSPLRRHVDITSGRSLQTLDRSLWCDQSPNDSWKSMLPPCVVLVINDNPYGLMFALRYFYRSCPQEILEFMCWTLLAFHVGHCFIQGFKWRMVMYRVELIASMSWRKGFGDLSLLSSRHHHMKKEEKIQGWSSVWSTHKATRCTKWDYVSHGMVSNWPYSFVN